MKNTFKRIAAFAVMICMLLSVVPAVAFAEETVPQQLDTITYDFRLNQTNLTFFYTNNEENLGYAGINIAEASNKGRDSRAGLAEHYANGDINWKYHEISSSISSAHFVIAANNEDGTAKVDYGAYIRGRDASNVHMSGVYFAVMIKSPGTGDYKLSLNYYKTKTAAPKGSVYVMPAGVTDIDGAMNYYEPVGSFTNDSTVSTFTSADAEMGTVSMKAGKDYLLVFTMDEVNASGNSYLYIGDVTLDLQAPAQNLDTITYDFGQGRRGDTYDGTATGTSFSGIDVHNSNACKSALSTKYANGDLQWKYHSSGMYIDSTNTTFSFGYAKTTVNYNLLLRAGISSAQIAGGYFATTIRSPGTGNYAVTLDYFTHTTGAAQGSVYVLPGDTTDIAAAINAGTAVGTFSCESSNSNGTTLATGSKTFDNAVAMEAGKEYLLVFTSDALSSRDNTRAALYLGNVTMNRIVSQNEIDYDFDLRNEEYTYAEGDDRKFAGLNISPATGTAPVAARNVMDTLYSNGDINWDYHSVGNTVKGTATSYGFGFGAADVNYNLTLTSSNLPGSYFATTIKSPGYGNYELTVDYFTHSTGASQASVYILPSDTADIAAAIAAGTAVGTFSCDGAFTNAKVLGEGTATYDVSLGMAEEYLLVFTNDAVASSRGDRASLYLGGVKLTNKAAGGAEEEIGDYIVDGVDYETFAEAVRAAFESDQIVALNKDVTVNELKLTEDITIDLNGKTFTANAFSGKMIDSSDGNTGLLASQKDNVVFSSKNTDAPLYDATAGGYRLFDYTLELYDGAEEVEGAAYTQKFWFKYHFRTSDAAEAALDEDAYAIVAAGDSGVTFGVELYWNDEALEPAVFGLDGSADAFAQGWADGATASRWLWVNVQGLNPASMNGTLVVVPVVEVNNVRITSGKIVYTCGEIAE